MLVVLRYVKESNFVPPVCNRIHMPHLPTYQFVCTRFWLISYFLIIEFTCFKQFFNRVLRKIRTCLPAGRLPSFDLQSNTYAMSASRTFTLLKAESKGFEPLHRVSDDGLAGHYNTTLSTLHFFAERKRFELLIRLPADSLFSRQLPWPSGLSPLCERVGSSRPRRDYRPLRLSNFAALTFEDEERFELSTRCLTNTRSAVELFILFCLNDDLGRLKGCFRFW